MKLTSILSRLIESKFDYKELSPQEKSQLNYLIHDKKHVTSMFGMPFPVIDKAIKLYSEKAPILYRGIYETEISTVNRGIKDGGFSFGRYSSFSENNDFALKYAKRTKYFVTLKNGSGFCYWKYLMTDLEKLRNDDPKSFSDQDGDFLIDSAKEEAEWILDKDAKYKVTSVNESGEYKIVNCEML